MLYLWPQESGSDPHKFKFVIWKVSKSIAVAAATTNNNIVCDYIMCSLYYNLVYVQHNGRLT